MIFCEIMTLQALLDFEKNKIGGSKNWKYLETRAHG
jgi:hypothetical protein